MSQTNYERLEEQLEELSARADTAAGTCTLLEEYSMAAHLRAVARSVDYFRRHLYDNWVLDDPEPPSEELPQDQSQQLPF